MTEDDLYFEPVYIFNHFEFQVPLLEYLNLASKYRQLTRYELNANKLIIPLNDIERIYPKAILYNKYD